MEQWIPAHATNTRVGDIVRVRHDAFTIAKTADMHNGRICEVTEIRGGDFIVKSIDDREPYLKRTFYSPNILEKKVTE